MESKAEILKKLTMDLGRYNPNRLATPATIKFELVSEIQASLNAIDSEESFRHNIQKMLKLYYAIERLRHIEPHWLFEVKVISAAGSLV